MQGTAPFSGQGTEFGDDKTRASVIINDGAVFTTRKRISAFPTLVSAEELSLQIRKKADKSMNPSVFLPCS